MVSSIFPNQSKKIEKKLVKVNGKPLSITYLGYLSSKKYKEMWLLKKAV